MNKLHTYLLPISLGSISLLLTPLNEQAAVSYPALAVAVVLGVIGLHSLAKQKEISETALQQALKVLEEATKASSTENAKNLQHQKETIEAGNGTLQKQLETTKENNDNVQQQFTQLSAVIIHQLEKMEQAFVTATVNEQTELKQAIQKLQEKVGDGNAVVENVSILMIQEQKNTAQLLEELNSMQAVMPNELSMLQDSITANQQDIFDTTRTVEIHLEKLAGIEEIVQGYLEASATTHEQVVDKITDEFTAISTKLDVSADQLFKQFTASNEQTNKQISTATHLIEKTDQLQIELAKANEQATSTVTKQLNELKGLNKSLLQGIGQIADSKSTERQQLLKIQKELIKEYSK